MNVLHEHMKMTVTFPHYTIRLRPRFDGMPSDWQLLSESNMFREPFCITWEARTELQTGDQPAIDHFELRMAGPGSKNAAVLTVSICEVDLKEIWSRLSPGIIRYDIVARDRDGKEIGCSLVHHFVKKRHPRADLQFSAVTLAVGARIGEVRWDGVNGALIRHIRPFHVSPCVDDASLKDRVQSWRIELAHTDGCDAVEGHESQVSVAGVWDSVPVGPCALRILALDESGSVVAISHEHVFKKGHRFEGSDGKPDATSQEYFGELIRRIARYASRIRSPKAFQPGLPLYYWHSSVDEWGNVSGSSYPSQYEVGVEAWLLYQDWALRNGDSQEASAAFDEARQMVDWTLAHRTPEGWDFAGLPATTLTMGTLGGHAEGSAISLPGIATIARTYVWMFEKTGEDDYLEASLVVAKALLRLQNDDGGWPWRIIPETGAPDFAATYTSQIIEIVRLLRLVDHIFPESSLRAAAAQGLAWILENPVRTNRWEGYYVDDPGERKEYQSVSHLDAVWTARFLIRHRDEDERFLSIASGINDWVEDHFVIYGRETHWGNSSIVSTEPITPAVVEKPFYQRTVTGHTANWMGLLLDLHRATGDQELLRKAVAACEAINAAVRPNGAVSPESPDRILLRRPVGESIWFWNVWCVMKALLEMELFDGDRA